MNARERFRAVMSFQPFDRLPLVEWATWWDVTLARWRTEGLPARFPGPLEDRYEIARHFGQDLYMQDWLRVCPADAPRAPAHGAGIIKSMDDYERLQPRLYTDASIVINRERWSEWARLQRNGDAVLWFTFEGFFWFSRQLLGIESQLYAFYDQPELLHRINSDLTAWMQQCLDALFSICTPDFMTFAEDMSYNNGPMISEELFDEFMLPYYEQVVPRMRERGVISIIDSDGDVAVPAAWFERAGLDGILPLERQAGTDIAQLRKDHPRMRFVGHFDKLTMNQGEKAMRAEFERLLPTAAQGGFLISVDHQTPPGVSYQEYKNFMSLFREYAEEAGRMSRLTAV